MICWRCQTSNSDFAVYCSKCGSPLTRKPGASIWKSPWLIVAAAGLGLLGVAAVLFVVLSRRPPASTPGTPEVTAAKAVTDEQPPLFLPGEVIVANPATLQMTRFAGFAVGSGWVATPLWALFGGTEIRFRSAEGPDFAGQQGFWNEGDPVILWRLADFESGMDSAIGAWERDAPLVWQPLSAGTGALRLEVVDPQQRGLYLSFALPPEIKAAGALCQATRVVGWTFGEGTEKGYLWAGPEEADLATNLAAAQVFGSVAASGREFGFFRALALGDEADPAERLSALARGFELAPSLEDADLPERLRTRSVVSLMRALASDLVQNGRSRDVVRILGDGVLKEAADPELVQVAVVAQTRDLDFNRAIQYLERLRKSVFEAQGRSSSELEPFRARLYKDWLREILDKGGYFNAQVAYEEAARAFPADPEIRLLGVEVALTENNLARAKALLQATEVPPGLKERANYLAARLKTAEEEEALVIPFNPGEKRIYVEAKVNGRHLQKFLVDTGATVSSIPSTAAAALGITIDLRTPVRWIATASGVVGTYEVFLDSIDIMGYRVQNIKVLILDLPTDETLGVIGMDFLNNFRYEIDNKAGVFRLRKK